MKREGLSVNETVSLAVGGDCFPNGHFYRDGRPISAQFAATLDVLARADLRFTNFETPLSDRGRPAEKLAAIRSDPELAADFGKLGFDIVTLANNHVTDYGPDALADTVDAFERLGIAHVGAGDSIAAALQPVVLERNGLKVGFIAFTCLAAPGAPATEERPGVAAIRVHSGYEVNPLWELEEPGEPLMVTIRTRVDEDDCSVALERVRALRAEVDLLCVSIHWGYGGGADLAEYQRPLAHAVVEAGADAVLGNHVHGVQGIEIYEGAPVLYSPGTLVGKQIPFDLAELDDTMLKVVASMSPDGYVASLRFGRDGGCEVELTPTSVDENGLAIPAADEVLERIVERVVSHSEKLDTSLTFRDGTLAPTG
jgi:poly-gamma-glutamate capsule biosynthesis protein CapA/YwtB (metallophosphatase superfamily)